MTKFNSYKIVLVGKENSGKSTLFNHLLSCTKALTSAQPGMTTDLVRASWLLAHREIELIDSNGFTKSCLNQQYRHGIDESSLILFTHQANVPLDDIEQDLLTQLEEMGKKVILVLTKSDLGCFDEKVWYRYAHCHVSVVHNQGKEALCQLILPHIQNLDKKHHKKNKQTITIGILGQQNVGKSTFINTACHKLVSFVSSVPGTTTDPIEGLCCMEGKEISLVDTAGLKKSKTGDERYLLSQLASLKSSNHYDICLLLLDAERGMQKQDKKIIRLFLQQREKNGLIVIAKSDVVGKNKLNKIYLTYRSLFSNVPIFVISNFCREQVISTVKSALNLHNKIKLKSNWMQKWIALQKEKITQLRSVKYVSFSNNTICLHGRRLHHMKKHHQTFLIKSFIDYFHLSGRYISLIYKNYQTRA